MTKFGSFKIRAAVYGLFLSTAALLVASVVIEHRAFNQVGDVVLKSDWEKDDTSTEISTEANNLQELGAPAGTTIFFCINRPNAHPFDSRINGTTNVRSELDTDEGVPLCSATSGFPCVPPVVMTGDIISVSTHANCTAPLISATFQ